MAEKQNKETRPQPGPQEEFLKCPADIAIYGGGAGSGKSFALVLEPLRHIDNARFGGVIFRRTTRQIRNEGGLWDEAKEIYHSLRAELKETTLECTFSSGMRVQFAHLEHEKNVYDYQGAQIPFLGFDELTQFTEKQFFYLLSRNRSTSDVPGYVRATCNPDSRSWVRRFIDWWIDPASGFPIKERAGVLRWFIRQDDKIVWANSREEIIEQFGNRSDIQPKSVTFIPANIFDNQILMQKDPSYLSNLLALPRVERMQLLDGNWNVEPSAGLYFQKSWFEVVDAVPVGARAIRYWDRASSEVTESNKDPDWTVGLKLLKDKQGTFYVADMVRLRQSPLKVEQTILNTAKQDGTLTTIYIEQDPGQAGVVEAKNYTRLLAGFAVKTNKVTKDKITRALALSAQCEAGNVKVLRANWNEDLFTELQNFPEGAHDDIVDALSGAFNMHLVNQVGDFTPEMAKIPTHGTLAPRLGAGPSW